MQGHDHDVHDDHQHRDQMKRTFDRVANSYQDVRLEYPRQLFDDIVELTGLGLQAHVLEVGPGSGKATLPLARRGYHITCIELGVALAGEAQRNLAGFPNVTVIQSDFESWVPADDQRFDLLFAATAWHWIHLESRYAKAHSLLRPGGHLAFWFATHVYPEDGDPIFQELQPTYEELDGNGPTEITWPRPGQLAGAREEVEASGLFCDVQIRQYDWETVHNAESYIGLISTFSSHIAMGQEKRERLFVEIRRRLAARPDGLLRRHWGAVLHVARRA
jgi:SAM-dependent methyltransferase